MPVQSPEPATAAAAAATAAGSVTTPAAAPPNNPENDDEASEVVAAKGERGKFLPRVKVLLTKDNEELLSKLVEVLELTNCAAFRSAAVDNPWFEAFERFYDSIEVDYVKPGGKNRIHKFKSKVVDMWAMMESEIEAGEKSPSDPIYSKAMRQWSVHQSVMKDPVTEIMKHKPPPVGNSNNGETPRVAATTATSAVPAAFATTDFELDRIRKSILRLERTMVVNGWAQPKLPSPLNELHYLKEQMSATHFDVNVRETYQREITKFLTAARHQARHSNAPAHLPSLLDGIDSLQNTSQPQQLAWSLKETYDFVLRAYLKLLEPSVEPTPRKRKRDDDGPAESPVAAATPAQAETKEKEDEPPSKATEEEGTREGEEEVTEV